MNLSLLLTTVGRPTLLRTLLSLDDQDWRPGDEVVVASDDDHEGVGHLLTGAAWRAPFRHLPVPGGPHGDWGHTPRNLTMRACRGDYICHFDDDDVAAPDMVSVIRRETARLRGVYLFRYVNYRTGKLIWGRQGLLRRRNISTQNIVHPNEPATFGVWGRYYGGDSQFIIDTAGRYPGLVKWRDLVTCVYGPPPDLSMGEVRDWLSRRPWAGKS